MGKKRIMSILLVTNSQFTLRYICRSKELQTILLNKRDKHSNTTIDRRSGYFINILFSSHDKNGF